MDTSDISRYLHVTRERVRQIVNDHESFPAPVDDPAAQVGRRPCEGMG
jgi:hypothetical protein